MNHTIALAGNPNSGKTTMFNQLTGSAQYVGNWPGVTVEKKEGRLKSDKESIIQDLPGIYSLSPYTLEEVVSRTYLIEQRPEAIINVIDASNLERNLYLTTQLAELGVSMVLALNMMDTVKKRGQSINKEKLGRMLGCDAVFTAAVHAEGMEEVAQKAKEAATSGRLPKTASFSSPVENALQRISALIQDAADETYLRWLSIKLFERDEKVMSGLDFSETAKNQLEAIIAECEAAMDDDSESIITSERYQYIAGIMGECVQKGREQLTVVSDRIDTVVTNRILALPIFAFVMWLVYFISMATVGTMGTDWVNDVLFADIVAGTVDAVLGALGISGMLASLIQDGIVAGAGAVLGFLPQMMVLFFCLAILEDCGYMARIAFIMDRMFRRFGLSGKSFIPMLVAIGCGVPGVMASRTIENERDRKLTIMTTTFMPCGAKLPIIALIAGALFDGSPAVAASAYFVGIAAIVCSGIILKKMKTFAGEPAPFVMELPAYHIPSGRNVLLHMWDKAKSFVRRAGVIILPATILVWFLSTFSWSLSTVEDTADSILASVGNLIAPLFAPLGWGDWQSAVAAFTGLIAKENVVGTFGVLFEYAGELSEDGTEIWSTLAAAFTPAAGYSFLVFNLLCAPCFAAIGAIKREMGSAKWTMIAVGYQCLLAYVAAMWVYQFGRLLSGEGFSTGTAVAATTLLGFLYLLLRPAQSCEKKQLCRAGKVSEAR